MTTVTAILDHATRAVARLAIQFKTATRLQGLISAIAGEVQAIEDAFNILREQIRDLDTAEGDALNKLGRLVGAPERGSKDDAAYRARIKATIDVNKSRGVSADMYAISKGVVETWNVDGQPRIIDNRDACFTVGPDEESTLLRNSIAEAKELAKVLNGSRGNDGAKAAGVRAIVMSRSDTVDNDKFFKFAGPLNSPTFGAASIGDFEAGYLSNSIADDLSVSAVEKLAAAGICSKLYVTFDVAAPATEGGTIYFQVYKNGAPTFLDATYTDSGLGSPGPHAVVGLVGDFEVVPGDLLSVNVSTSAGQLLWENLTATLTISGVSALTFGADSIEDVETGYLAASDADPVSVTEFQRETITGTATKLSLTFDVPAPDLDTSEVTFTLRKNGADTSMVVDYASEGFSTPGTRTVSTTVGAFSVASGDLLSIAVADPTVSAAWENITATVTINSAPGTGFDIGKLRGAYDQ